MRSHGGFTILRRFALLVMLCLGSVKAAALEGIVVPLDMSMLDIAPFVEWFERTGERMQVSTAPGADGLVRRIEVRASKAGDSARWAAFALTNESDIRIERLLVADYYQLLNSGVIWPDLGVSRIASITPSRGVRPVRQPSEKADVFKIVLDPGETITFVLELQASTLPGLYLWEETAYKNKLGNFSFFYGVVTGVSGLLALLLTIVFVVRWSAFFPTAAAFSWVVFAYLCLDSGLWEHVLKIPASSDPVYRAGMELMMPVTLLLFLFTFLRLNREHVFFSYGLAFWLFGLLSLFALVWYQAPVVAGLARLSLAALGIMGFCVIVSLSFRRSERAIMLLPTSILLLIWLFAAGAALNGSWSGDFVSSSVTAMLVMVVLVMTFTVMQYAFSGGASIVTQETDTGRKALALSGSGDAVWDWDVVRDLVLTGTEIERILGCKEMGSPCSIRHWLRHVHPADRSHFEMMLQAAVKRKGGRVDEYVRMSREDGHYAWIHLKARPVLGSHGEIVRCIGTLSDVTVERAARERLLNDAIHDNLTGLPNRDLFLDRLRMAVIRARVENATRPTLFILDLDHFSVINEKMGIMVGDSILLMVARRLRRNLKQNDTLARLFGDRFGILLISEGDSQRIAAFAEMIRRTLKTPIKLGDTDMSVTASMGIAVYDGHGRDTALLHEAEIAMGYAKRMGPDNVEAFRPEMKYGKTNSATVESELRQAIDRDEIEFLYRPIVRLSNFSVIGFETVPSWKHPRFGKLALHEFFDVAEDSGLVVDLGLKALNHVTRHLGSWRDEPFSPRGIFVSVNILSAQLLRQDLINDVKQALLSSGILSSCLKIGVTEALVMENPECALCILKQLHDMDVGLMLNDFGACHSSLGYLERLPFDMIRIDQSFLRLNSAGNRSVLLRPIVELSRHLGMKIMAEGVESDEDVQDLYDLGYEFAQGVFFGESVKAKQAYTILKHGLKNVAKTSSRST